MPLRHLQIRLDYRPDVCPDPVAEFYAPALAESVAYDRATYTFSANGLASAAAGLAGLLRNDGRVRLICHFEMEEPTVRAIIRGQVQAREAMLARVAPEDLTAVCADDIRAKSQLDLIAWLIANRRLEVKIALRAGGLFHSKIGVMADAQGDRVAFEGSVNETAAGWSRNYESFSAFASWREPERVQSVADHFDVLWNDRSATVRVVPMPDDYANYLALAAPAEPPAAKPTPEDAARAEYWKHIRDALANDPASTLATIPAALWHHQQSFLRARIDGDRRVLIADEVGLGKTMQAGAVLKTQINRRAADRALIIAPKPALAQWQSELRDKFCLDIPILDSSAARLRLRYADPGRPPEPAPSPIWRVPKLIVSDRLMVSRADEFLADAPRCDIAIVDEAHRARYGANGGPPNRFLALLSRLSPLADGMLLLTATPMQTAASDLWALLRVLEPDGWSREELDDFYDDAADLTQDRIGNLRDLFTRDRQPPERLVGLDRAIWSGNPAVFAARAGDPESRRAMLARMRDAGPIRRLMSRHTRGLLENYRERGLLDAKMPRRIVRAVPIEMSAAERELYNGIDALVRGCYANPLVNETAFGFIMTTYRRRLGSSARAYAQTVRNLLERRRTPLEWSDLQPDEAPDDDQPLPSPPLSADQKADLRRAASAADRLSRADSKYAEFKRQLDALKSGGHDRVIVFTQFRDTQAYLMQRLESAAEYGETHAVWGGDSGERLSRPERIARVRERGGVLICTETAAESLNLQFCSAIINYDMPWNPMTLEQRIGRIDRIGQERDTVEIVNLFYADTAEWDAYQAMDERLDAIGERVGPYRDILRSQLADVIAAADREADPRSRRAAIDAQLNRILAQMPPDRMPIDLDAHNSEITPQPPPAARAAVDMAHLRRCLDDPSLLPTGWRAVPEGGPHWRITDPDGRQFSATTDRDAYEKANGRVQWFGPGSPAFPL